MSTLTVTVPQPEALDRGQIDDILAALEAGQQPPSLPVSASVFEIGSPVPNKADPAWQHLVATLREVRTAVLDGGWRILVEGYTDEVGSPAFNEQLSQQRADATRDAVIADAGYPPGVVDAEGRGIGGTDVADRRVLVSFIRSSLEGQT